VCVFVCVCVCMCVCMCVWTFIHATWLMCVCMCVSVCIHTCDMTHTCDMNHLYMKHDSHMQNDSFVHATWPIHTWHMTHWHVRHDSFIHAIWQAMSTVSWTRAALLPVLPNRLFSDIFATQKCDMTHLHVCAMTLLYVRNVLSAYGFTTRIAKSLLFRYFGSSSLRHDSSIHVTRPSHMWDMTHSHVRHDSFKLVVLPRVSPTCDMTHSHKCDSQLGSFQSAT